MKIIVSYIAVVTLWQGVSGSPETVLSPDFQVHIIGADESGNPTIRKWVSEGANPNRNLRDAAITNGPKLDYPNYRIDSLVADRNFSSGISSIMATGPANIEIVIVVDKEFGDLFSHNYQRIVDYLTVYFWDVNIRYKTLPSLDISFRVNGLLIMESTQAQPFIEKARASDGRAEFGRILGLYMNWIYEQRGWLVRHDLAPLITATRLEWGGGLAWGSGTCGVDNGRRIDWGTCVWNDGGDWGSVTVGAHEMAHTIGAPHDDDPNANCPPPYGFIMSGGNDNYRYFFSDCSDRHISRFVNSDSAACLRSIDGLPTTPMHPRFSSPKAPSVLDLCKKSLKNPNAWVDDADTYDCKQLRCKRRDESNPSVIWTHFLGVLDNSICGKGSGRCFRGRCRLNGKLIQNQFDGNCIATPDLFGHMVPAKMSNCPPSKDITPLNSLEIRDGPGDKRLGTPFTESGNTENAERCLYAGNGAGGTIWTDRCNYDNPWHGWEFRSVGTVGNFLLVHKVTGLCAIPAGGVDYMIQMFPCKSGNMRMVWRLTPP
ncbi:uncharacterized protein LOC110850459 [Folsomia candida]|uniref:uncharacterized protein LOC110850459 n=1 Tax=Folsomia candida TaxID=158441 RepID=UPI000B8FE739|nr:uncharacterized protein LOC110850459 [Folsomia candida]